MNIDELTLGQIKEIQSLGCINKTTISNSPFEIGEGYLIRTVTHIWHGAVSEVQDGFLTLKDAAWIADTGRFHDALKDPTNFNEVEPAINPVIINIGSIIDATKLQSIKHLQK
jgi:hypothetical protein